MRRLLNWLKCQMGYIDGTRQEEIRELKERMKELERRAYRLERKAEIYRGR